MNRKKISAEGVKKTQKVGGEEVPEMVVKKTHAEVEEKISAKGVKKTQKVVGNVVPAMGEGKKDVVLGELGELRRALEVVEKLRFARGVTAEEYVRLESASVDLRDREREIIAKLGAEIVAQIKASSLSLAELSKRIKTRTAKLSKLPKSLDKISTVILEIIDIARRIDKEL